jgi:hypothetical protein
MESKIVGYLNAVEYDVDFFESEPFPIPYFSNKKIKIGFIEARHQTYLIGAEKTLQNFLKLDDYNRINDSQLVYDYYSEILKHGYTRPLTMSAVSDIWLFVYPTEIIIFWDENGDFDLRVSCGCDWEKEHGLQLIFKDGEKLTKASGHE